MNKVFAAVAVAVLSFLAVCLWSVAVRAAVCEESNHRRVPLSAHGAPGETVLTYDLKCSSPIATRPAQAPRKGRTTVVARLGARRASTLRVAALDVARPSDLH